MCGGGAISSGGKISIALATFNGEKYLRELLESVYRQTRLPDEVIVCDDGSTDGTIDIIQEYARTRGLQYEINSENLGYIKNFEKTISLCSGDYIALCDQDDRWKPEKLQCLVEGIGTHSLICSDAVLINDSGGKIYDSYRRYKCIYIPHRHNQTSSIVFGNYVMGCTSLFRKKDFTTPLYPFPDGIPHDWWLAIIMSMKDGIKYINKPLIDYRLHGHNIIGAVRTRLYDDIRNLRKKIQNQQNHLAIVMAIKRSLFLLNELENRSLMDQWMISLKDDLHDLLDDFATSLKHPKANRIIWKYLNYFCPSPNPFVKLMFLIENFHE